MDTCAHGMVWKEESTRISMISSPASLRNRILVSKLSTEVGHNSYGESAWPNDILYIFPSVILGIISIILGLSVVSPLELLYPANAFATPTEILPEWYFLPSFNLLRVLPNKLIGVSTMLSLVIFTLAYPLFTNLSIYSNPFRRPISTLLFLYYTSLAIWLSIGALSPSIYTSLPLI